MRKKTYCIINLEAPDIKENMQQSKEIEIEQTANKYNTEIQNPDLRQTHKDRTLSLFNLAQHST